MTAERHLTRPTTSVSHGDRSWLDHPPHAEQSITMFAKEPVMGTLPAVAEDQGQVLHRWLVQLYIEEAADREQ